MPRRTSLTDHRQRPRAKVTQLEIRQRDQITQLTAELRALRKALANANRPHPAKRMGHTHSHTQKQANMAGYDAFLDQMGRRIDRLVDKGRDYYGTCPTCHNVALATMGPLIELERLEYGEGHYEALIFPHFMSGAGTPRQD